MCSTVVATDAFLPRPTIRIPSLQTDVNICSMRDDRRFSEVKVGTCHLYWRIYELVSVFA